MGRRVRRMWREIEETPSHNSGRGGDEIPGAKMGQKPGKRPCKKAEEGI